MYKVFYFLKLFSASTPNNSNHSTPKPNNVVRAENDLTSPQLAEDASSIMADTIKENKLESDNLNDRQTGEASSENKPVEVNSVASEGDSDQQCAPSDSNLPEGFFDDPVQDAKVTLKYICHCR